MTNELTCEDVGCPCVEEQQQLALEEPDPLVAQMLPCPGCGNTEDLYLDLWGHCSDCGTTSAHMHTREDALERWNRVAKAVQEMGAS